MILSVLLIGLGYKFIARTYQINFTTEQPGDVKLLSYNVRVFNSYSQYRSPETEPAKLIQWVANHEANIKCFQEFYHYTKYDTFNVIPKLIKNTPNYYFEPSSIVYGTYFGMAIFTKYPIINKGEIVFQKKSLNQAIYIDILVNKDTLRVYNIHLQSMSIDEAKLPVPSSENLWSKVKYLFNKLKKGAIYRSAQVQLVLDHMEKCPYKIILAGDLNDTPYSYSYEVFRKRLNNSFEEEGSGFEFTYGGKLFFLRIDNVFADKSIEVNTFKTRRDIKFTDHFPLEVSFTF